MLIHSATQLLTLSGGPQRGRTLGSLGIIENGAVLIRDEKIVATGKTDDLRYAYPSEPGMDATGWVLLEPSITNTGYIRSFAVSTCSRIILRVKSSRRMRRMRTVGKLP